MDELVFICMQPSANQKRLIKAYIFMKTKITKNTVATLFLMSAMALNVQSQTTLTWGRQIGTEKEK